MPRVSSFAVLALALLLAAPAFAQRSVGRPGTSSLDDGSFFLTARFYYASASTAEGTRTIVQPDGTERTIPVFGDESDSVRTNALGDEQVLFYDYYAPQRVDADLNDMTVIFYHGGGYQNGAANSACGYYSIQDWVRQGFHGIVIGYRRGWWGDGSGSPSQGTEFTPEESQQFLDTVAMALEDVQDAWAHYDTDAPGHGRWYSGDTASQVHVPHSRSKPRYVAIGNSAGGSLVSRSIHTHEYPDPSIQVVGAIVGFGTHSADEPVLTSHNSVPTIVVTGLFDPISPAYDNHAFFAEGLPLAKGLVPFYQELDAKGYPARLLISPQNGHGWAKFGHKDFDGNDVCTKSIPDFAVEPGTEDPVNQKYKWQHMSNAYALTYFMNVWKDRPVPNYQHFRYHQKAIWNNPSQPEDAITGKKRPKVDDEGDLYEQIGRNEGQVLDVLDIDPAAAGLDPATHLHVDGFVYGDDPENELGHIVVERGFRYEPVQTEFENRMTPDAVVEKYSIPTGGSATPGLPPPPTSPPGGWPIGNPL